MKYLNLDSSFEPLGTSIEFQVFTFDRGVPYFIIIDQLYRGDAITICTRIRSFNDLGLLLLAVDALRRIGVEERYLLLPYFPAGREDRVQLPGEPLSVKFYADLINAMNFREVKIIDPHSKITSGLLDRVIAISNHQFVEMAIGSLKDYVLIAPDVETSEKVFLLSHFLDGKKVVECSEQIDEHTGKSTHYHVGCTNLNQQTCVVVDSVCTDGRSFITLAKALKKKNAGELILVVTHGLFTEGIDELKQYYSSIFCTDSFSTIEDESLQQIKIARLLGYQQFCLN